MEKFKTNFTYSETIAHASLGKSKSKYKGGFRNGKNTKEYNHDYYIKNKDKWDKKYSREKKENEVSFDEIPKGAKITSSESVYAEDHLPKWARGKVDTENNMRIRYGYVKNDDGSYTRFAKHARFSYRPNLPELNKKKSGNSDESNRPHGRKRNDSGKTVEVKKRDKVENLDRPHGRKRNDHGKTSEVTTRRPVNKPKVSKEYEEELANNSKKNEYSNKKENNWNNVSTWDDAKTWDKEPKQTSVSNLQNGSKNTLLKKGIEFSNSIISAAKKTVTDIKKEGLSANFKGKTRQFNFIQRALGYEAEYNMKRAEDEINSNVNRMEQNVHGYSREMQERTADRIYKLSKTKAKNSYEYYNSPLYKFRKLKKKLKGRKNE